jgi:hypothetical protein
VLAAALIYRFALFVAIPILFGLNRIWLRRQETGAGETIDPDADERTSIG